MTGPEHYQEAERMLAGAGCATAETAGYVDPVLAGPWLAAAQVHATLALAAATALANNEWMPDPDLGAWKEAASAGTVTLGGEQS